MLRFARLLSALSCSAAVAFAPAAQAQGEVCSNAAPISGPGTHVWQNVGVSSSGFNGGGPCANYIRNDVFYQWTATASGDFRFDTYGSPFDTHMAVHAGSGCAATCITSNDNAGGTLQSEVVVSQVIAGETYLVQVGSFHLSTGTGQLNITQVAGECSNFIADVHEPNNGCGQAALLTAGSESNLWVDQSDIDFFAYQVQPGETLTVLVAADSPGDVDLRLYDGGCGWLEGDGTSVSVQNLQSNPITYVVMAYLDTNGDPSPCAEYTLTATIDPDPCFGYTEDSYEPNDFCPESFTLMSETLVDLAISKWDKDVYQVCIPPGETLTVDLLFEHDDGDIDMFLLPTWSYPCAIGTAGFYFTSSESINDDEQVSWFNGTSEPMACYIEVIVYEGSLNSCNRYDMTVQGAGPCYIGDAFCEPAVPNSIGLPARIGAFGSFYAADSLLELSAWYLPPNQFGYFLASRQQGFLLNPGGSMGNLCLSTTSALARLNRPEQIGQVSGHTLTVPIDISAIPLPPTGNVTIQAGETWHFQCWYRDSVGGQPASNFTHGLTITYR